MSSNSPVPASRTPVPVPRTAVPLGIADPVEKARAELKAALAAIEVKANVPRRVSRVIDDSVEAARLHTAEPALAATAVIAAAAAAIGRDRVGARAALHALTSGRHARPLPVRSDADTDSALSAGYARL